MTKFVYSSIALACMTVVSSAAASDVPEIIVTAKNQQTIDNVLQTAHVFDLESIEASQVKDIPALIDRVAGISLNNSGGRGTTTSVFVRGVSNSQTIVLVDGVRVGSATLGAAALNNYPIEAIERVEILKGPFSGIYGADAVGGVIQLFTKKGGDGIGAVSASVGSDSLEEFNVSFNGGNERNSFYISAHSEDTDGIDRTSILTDGNDDIDGFEETAVSFGGKASFGDSTFATLNILATDSTVEFDNLFGADPGSFTDSKTLSTAFGISSQIANGVSWNTTLGVNEDESETQSTFSSAFVTDRDSLSTEFVISLSDTTLLTAGADYYEESIESSNDFPVTERDNTGVFAQLTSDVGKVGVAASLRYDDNSAYGTNTNGSLALSYGFNDNLRVIASYGTAFVAPSFNFLFFPNFGNPDILPEESESAEISLVGQSGVLDWRISAYRTEIENLFSFDPDTFLAANVGQADIEGIEVSVNSQWADWQLSLNADILSAEDEATGIELDDRAEQTLSFSAARDFQNLNLQFDIKFESDRFDNSGTELASYALFDVSAIYAVNDNIKVFANIDNIFDKDYTVNLVGSSERFNTEGLQAKLGVRFSF